MHVHNNDFKNVNNKEIMCLFWAWFYSGYSSGTGMFDALFYVRGG